MDGLYIILKSTVFSEIVISLNRFNETWKLSKKKVVYIYMKEAWNRGTQFNQKEQRQQNCKVHWTNEVYHD